MTTLLYAAEIRTNQTREDESYRDWLHNSCTYIALPTRADALALARRVLDEDMAGRDPDDGPLPTITKWETAPDGTPYSDEGVWFETSDGEEGRVVIHTIQIGEHANADQA